MLVSARAGLLVCIVRPWADLAIGHARAGRTRQIPIDSDRWQLSYASNKQYVLEILTRRHAAPLVLIF
jgi:hypothetical protein